MSRLEIADLRLAGLLLLRKSIRQIYSYISKSPELVSTERAKRFGNRWKKEIAIDSVAQALFKVELSEHTNEDGEPSALSKIIVKGEEDLSDESFELTGKEEIHCIVDMIDGSDLLERNLSNWCSAVTFIDPQAEDGKKILGSFVVMTNKEIFYSTIENDGVWVQKPRHPHQNEDTDYLYIQLPNLSSIQELYKRTSLENASVCFYGQKASSLLPLFKYYNPGGSGEEFENTLLGYIAKIEEQKNNLIKEKLDKGHTLDPNDVPIDFRIYTLNGIPTVIKLIDYRVKEVRKIDAVFNLKGQRPHDVVAGVYLAMKAGAVVKNLDTRKDMTYEDLEKALMKPAEAKLRYIVASNRALADELEPLLLPLI